MNREKSECRSCGAAIFWAKTANGKMMPVDFEPVADGNLVMETVPGGKVIAHMLKPGEMFPESVGRHKSHFATCPNALSHRKAK